MCRSDCERTGRFVSKFLADLFQVFCISQHSFGNFKDGLSWRRDFNHAFAVAHKNIYLKLVFQEANLLADSGLRGMEGFGGLGQIQTLIGDFA